MSSYHLAFFGVICLLATKHFILRMWGDLRHLPPIPTRMFSNTGFPPG